MKVVAFLSLFVSISFLQPSQWQNKFIGKWKGVDRGEVGYLNFREDGYFSFELNGETLGGESFDFHGKRANMMYSINTNTNPIEVDLVINALDEQVMPIKMLCIASFMNDSTIQFAMGFDGVRPLGFDEENSLIFKKQP